MYPGYNKLVIKCSDKKQFYECQVALFSIGYEWYGSQKTNYLSYRQFPIFIFVNFSLKKILCFTEAKSSIPFLSKEDLIENLVYHRLT